MRGRRQGGCAQVIRKPGGEDKAVFREREPRGSDRVQPCGKVRWVNH